MIQQKQCEMKAKRLSKAQRLDIITTLPQAIIESILCLLPIEEAARTSILTREWRYKWTKIPKLVFLQSTVKRPIEGLGWRQLSMSEYARITKDMRSKLLHTIHQVLLQRQGPIHEFTLLMEADENLFEIDQIILHLTRNYTVKKLTLDFDYSVLYSLPVSFFSFHHLTDLYLAHCNVSHKPIFNDLGSLTRLSLYYVKISKETLLHLLSNSPSLKRLCLFIYDGYWGYESPNIVELFKCLPMVEHLTTCYDNIQLLLKAGIPQELPFSLIHLKYCGIKDMWFDNILSFLGVLIKSSPNLEKIEVEISVDDYREHDEIASLKLEGLEEYSDVCLEHLNELEIKNFRNSKLGMEFVKFIMARSPNLKKVMLQIYKDDENNEWEMSKILLHAPRASQVEIVLVGFYEGLLMTIR